MLVNSRRRWRSGLLASSLVLTVAACAPNTARTPMAPQLGAPQAAAEREDSRYGSLLRMASSTRAAGDPASATQLYQQAIAQDAARPEAYVLLGETLIDLEAYDDAGKVFREALQRDADNHAAHRGYARTLVALRRPESAIQHYEAVLRRAPDDLQALNGLGVAHDLSGRHDAAQVAYRRGLQVAPESVMLRNNLGLSLALAGQHDEAIRTLRTLADEPGARPRNRQNLALAYGLAGNLAAAERISRVDLDEAAVENNLAYFAMLAALDDRRQRAAVLGVEAPDRVERAGDADAGKRLAAIALDGDGLELGLAPTGRWFVNLGQYPTPQQAASAWRDLRDRHAPLLGGLTRLAGAEGGPQPLLVGPLASAEQAEGLCGSLRNTGQACRAVPL
jgi:Flp pilus assembly protein TadD